MSGNARYQVFSTLRFRNAPFSKFWACCTFAGSCALIPFKESKNYFLFNFPAIKLGKQLWTCFTSKLFFLDAKDIVAGCFLVYLMRSVERRMGTKKYVDFLLLNTLTVISLEFLLFSIIDFYLADISLPILASGPYAALCSCLVQFFCDVPHVSFASIYGVPLSEKVIPCFLAFILFISSKEARIPCLCGLIAGVLYRRNVLYMSKLSLIPNWFSKFVDAISDPLKNLGEDRTGRVLPIGATIEAQRQEIMDRLEQRMIYEQLRRQHMRDQQRGGIFLNAARRFFGAPLNEDGVDAGQAPNRRAAANVPEDKITALVDMGFSNRQRVVDVLRSTGNDLNAAAHILLQQPDQ